MDHLQEVIHIFGKDVEDVRDLRWQWMKLVERNAGPQIVTEQEGVPLGGRPVQLV